MFTANKANKTKTKNILKEITTGCSAATAVGILRYAAPYICGGTVKIWLYFTDCTNNKNNLKKKLKVVKQKTEKRLWFLTQKERIDSPDSADPKLGFRTVETHKQYIN